MLPLRHSSRNCPQATIETRSHRQARMNNPNRGVPQAQPQGAPQPIQLAQPQMPLAQPVFALGRSHNNPIFDWTIPPTPSNITKPQLR